ncbi:MAG: hypothetical protein GX234_05590 [Clostridiales bacterium]|nr:hypothetical protein [Clostridiales bacterium]
MTAENMIGLVIYGLVALFMMGIGVTQLKSKEPVGFYSGEKPPKAENVTDIKAWNRKHGLMWLVYGMIILVSFFIGNLFGDSVWAVIPMVGGVIVPVIFMIWYHHQLRKKYLK